MKINDEENNKKIQITIRDKDVIVILISIVVGGLISAYIQYNLKDLATRPLVNLQIPIFNIIVNSLIYLVIFSFLITALYYTIIMPLLIVLEIYFEPFDKLINYLVTRIKIRCVYKLNNFLKRRTLFLKLLIPLIIIVIVLLISIIQYKLLNSKIFLVILLAIILYSLISLIYYLKK